MKNISFALIAFTVLTGCTLPSEPLLDSSEVMQNAAVSAQNVISADLVINAQAAIQTATAKFDVSIDSTGVMSQGGSDVEFYGTINANGLLSGMPVSLQMNGSVIKLQDSSLFVNIQSLQAEPVQLLETFGLQNIESTWQQIIEAQTGSTLQPVVLPLSPAKLNILTVQEENFSNSMYEYKVILDQEKLQSVFQDEPDALTPELVSFLLSHDVMGTIWIDSENFYTTKLHWFIVPKVRVKDQYTIDFTVTFSNINNGQTITAPTQEVLVPN